MSQLHEIPPELLDEMKPAVRAFVTPSGSAEFARSVIGDQREARRRTAEGE